MLNTGIGAKLGIGKTLDNLERNIIPDLKARVNVKLRNKQKIFCVGRNKTGTTSLAKAFEELGFIVGNQRKAELLGKEFRKGNYDTLIKYCLTAEVFQDFPFSYPPTYRIMDKAFPNSKFILTIRDSDEQWFNSLLNFHSKIFGNGKEPTVEDLKNADYVEKDWVWENKKYLYNMNEDSFKYDKQKLTKHYNDYNAEVISYFKESKNDLLILNLSEPNSYKKLCEFINVKSTRTDFPWENKTADIKK
ncbi:MAG: hypothetical protein JJT77_09970 [Crocinitomicaceae bacterium]|nr:hypothetical protein [Crocinitomicaceae bacterium]